jgi:hypothetical protein
MEKCRYIKERIRGRNTIMTQAHRSIIAAFMAIALAAGSVGLAVADLQDCLPKACCCMKDGHKAAAHMLQVDTKSGCTAKAPCCQMAPVHKVQDIAALTSTPELPETKALIQAFILGQRFAAQLTSSLAHTFEHNGKPGAPRVPLYLETQMLLC